MKKAVFPGSFDPITKGHEAIVKRALPLFDEIVVAIGSNSGKSYYFSLEQRLKWIETVFKGIQKVSIATYEGLTVDFCKKINAGYILRGLRNPGDFEFERAIAQMNSTMAPGIETICIFTAPELSAINSTIVRDIHKNGGDASLFVPDSIKLK